ncbi:MAG: polysaccharide pyruvyl transferase family protein [Cyanobacteria bacterium P01_G01_bin.39]
MNRNKKVLICGYYGYHNLGDEAMLSGILTLLKKVQPDLVPTVLSSNPSNTKTIHSIKAIKQGGNFLDKLRRLFHYVMSDYFILGGGDLLRDTAKSSIANSWLSSVQKAIKFKCCTIVLGVSVGEIFKDETKKLIPEVLNQVDYIGVRDFQSKLKLENLGVVQKIHIVKDLALENSAKYNLNFDYSHEEKKPINVGMAVRKLSNRGPSVNPQTYSNVAIEIAAFIDLLVEKHDVKIHMLPFQASQVSSRLDSDDYACSLEIVNLSNCPDRFVVHRCFESVEEYIEMSRELDVVVGMRLHSLILAAGIGIPAIGIEYDPKVRYFMNEVNQLENMVPLNCLDRHCLLAMAEKILQDLPNAQEKLTSGLITYRKSTDESIKTFKELLSCN